MVVGTFCGKGAMTIDYMGNTHRFDNAKEHMEVVGHLKEYDDYINAYRNESKQYDIYINSNNDEVLSYRSNNAFNYLIAFLSEEQCNYLKKLNQGDYIINEEREKFIDLVLNSEGDVK